LIVKSDGLSCTTGVPPLKKMSGDPESRGPLMRLTTDLGMGKENLVANFAHQMGVSSSVSSVNVQLAERKFSTHGVSSTNIKIRHGGHLTMLPPTETSLVPRTSNARS
jgi:hypothetical protein